MRSETVAAIAHQLAAVARAQSIPFSVVFHGGEPLLVGPGRFESICRTLRQALPKECGLHLQTNGVLLSDRILETCFQHDVGISISVDGPAKLHDDNRIDHRGRGSHEKVLSAIKRLARHPYASELFSGVLAVIDVKSNPPEVYEFLKSTGAPSIDFLYRDGNHDVLPIGKSAPHSTEYGEWLGKLLNCYLNDNSPVPIRVLDDMLKILIGGAGRKEGVGLTNYGILVIETDGSIAKNDTLKSASPTADNFEVVRSVFDCELTDVVRSTEFLDYHQSQRPSSPTCINCSYLNVCGGGMPSHRFSKERGMANPSIFCADQILLIDLMRSHLAGRKAVA